MIHELSVQIRRIDTTLPLPVYQTNGSVAFDIAARIAVEIPPKTVARIPANIVVQTPEGYALLIAARSSLPTKKGLSIPHGIGIIDRDYVGADDEVQVQVYNHSEQSVTVERGERIAQGLFVPVPRVQWQETQHISPISRGGFGSTGT